jgi:hypothetical protein
MFSIMGRRSGLISAIEDLPPWRCEEAKQLHNLADRKFRVQHDRNGADRQIGLASSIPYRTNPSTPCVKQIFQAITLRARCRGSRADREMVN